MRMRKRTCTSAAFVITAMLLPSLSPAQSSISFEEAWKLSLQNPLIRQAESHQSEIQAEADATKALFLPRASLSAQYVFLSEDLHLDLTPVRDAIVPLYETLGKYGQFSGVPNPDPTTQGQIPILPDDLSTTLVRGKMMQALSDVENAEWDKLIQKKQFGTVQALVSWPLYAGGRIRAAHQAAMLKTKAADCQYEAGKGVIAAELVERYYGWVLASQNTHVRHLVYQGMHEHFTEAKKIFAEGMLSEAELLHAKVYESQAGRELEQARRTEATALRALENTLGTVLQDSIIPSSPMFCPDTLPALEYYVQAALNYNPMLKQLILLHEQANTGIRAEKGHFLPSVAVQGTYDLYNHDLSEYAPEWTAGIGLSWTLFEGMAGWKKLEVARLKEKQVVLAEQKSKEDIVMLVTKLYHEMEGYRAQAKQLETEMEYTSSLVKMREKAFREEMASGTEVIDAHMLQAKSWMERLQALYAFDVTLARLLQVCGLTEQLPGLAASSPVNPDTKIH